MKKLLLLAGAVLSVISPLPLADPAFDRFADNLTDEWMRADPMAATSQQYFSGAEQDALDRRLTPITKAARTARVAIAKRGLVELKRFDPATLDSTQRISAAMLGWQLQDIVDSEPFDAHALVFDQFRGLHVRLVNFLSQTHPIRNRRDIENYLARLALVAGQLDEGIAQAREAALRGVLMPTFIATSALGQLDRFLAAESKENVLVASLSDRMAGLKELSADDRTRFTAAAAKIVADQVIPAFRRVKALLQEQLPQTTNDAGLWRLQDGDKSYAHALRSNTTTELTPEQVHEIGLKEVARIEGKMDSLLRQVGYADGPVKDRVERLTRDSQPSSQPDPRPALLAQYESILRDAERRAALMFDLRPQARIEVHREPAFTEKTAAAHYTGPSKDGTRPGIFWAPLPGPTFNIPGMRTLVYHEGVPGHHFQVALQAEMTTLPRFRRDRVFGGLPAFTEGWGLYAEQLAAENGWYDGDLKGQVGQLEAELFRARRLVVDTGLHAKRWTRQQAIDYGIQSAEVERYVVLPGQACAYKIGQLRILELRAKAQKALGPNFSLKEFHNALLRAGSVPLAVLDQVVDDYVAAARR